MKKILLGLLIIIPMFSFGQIPKDSLLYLLNKHDIKHKEIVFNQARIETSFGKTNSKYNLFGFINKNGLMRFSSYEEAVIRYKKWQDKYYKGGCYYTFLTNIKYASSKTYVPTLRKLGNKIN